MKNDAPKNIPNKAPPNTLQIKLNTQNRVATKLKRHMTRNTYQGLTHGHAAFHSGFLASNPSAALNDSSSNHIHLLAILNNDAANEAATRNWGSVSASCRREIMDRITSKVDWRKMLRYFVKTSQRANKRSTPKRS